MHRGWFAAVVLAGVLASVQVAAQPVEPEVQPEEASNPFELSDFEWRLVQRAMSKHDLTPLDRASAVGRAIEAIVVEPEDVFTPEDLFPDFLNVFHITSLKSVIRREVLMDKGDPFDPELAAESERNLRGPQVLSIALVLPMKGSTPDTIKLLVVTKDIWSLRMNTSFQVVGDALDFLSLSLSENNILGSHKLAALTMLLRPATIRLGETFIDPRLFGTRLQLSESFSVPFNLDTGDAEGFTGVVSLAQPLYSQRTKWAWGASVTAHQAIGRSFVGGQLRVLPVPDSQGTALGSGIPNRSRALDDPLDLLAGADPTTLGPPFVPRGGEVLMPFNWRERIFGVGASVTRSFGREIKQNISFGYELETRRFIFGVDDAESDSFTAAQVALFEETLLPRSERVGQVSASYRVFTPDFVQMRNFETLALPEDFRFGPSLRLAAGHADPILGSEARFESLSARFVYRWMLLADKDDSPSRNADIFAVDMSAKTRVEDGEFADNELRATVRNYTPVALGGRFVAESGFVHRFEDRSNSQTALGGGSGLRGFEIGQFLGRSAMTTNLEWRTLPFELFTLQFAAVGFYDIGGVAEEEDLSDMAFFHSVGLGARMLNPASNRIVLRLDWGVPLNGLGSGLPGRFSFGFEQAF